MILRTPIKGFKEEGYKCMLNSHDTALHKTCDFSPRHVRFCKPEDFSNLYIGKMFAFGSGLKGITHSNRRYE